MANWSIFFISLGTWPGLFNGFPKPEACWVVDATTMCVRSSFSQQKRAAARIRTRVLSAASSAVYH